MLLILIAVLSLSALSGALSALLSSEAQRQRGLKSSTDRNAIQRSGTTTSSPSDQSPPLQQTVNHNKSIQGITSVSDVRHGNFYRFQHASTGSWLAKPRNSSVDTTHAPRERTFLLEYSKKHSAWSIQSHLRTFLAYELSSDISIDRLWAKSFEMWLLEFTRDGLLLLKSKRLQRYVRVTGPANDQLIANAITPAEAARWVLLQEPSPQCNREEKDADVPKKDLLERLRGSCWGPEGHVKALPQALSSTAKFANAT
ncbi:fascin-like protein, putative, partial [Bodo saltans]